MTKCIYPITTEVVSEPNDVGEGENNEPMHINADEWTSFKLVPMGHERIIKSFEIKLGSVQRIQVGWMNNAANFKITNTALGVGDYGHSGY